MKAKIICCLLVCLFLPTEICGLLTEKRAGDSFLIPIDSLSLAGASIEGQVIWPDGDEPSIQVVEQWRLIGDGDAALLFSCGFGNPSAASFFLDGKALSSTTVWVRDSTDLADWSRNENFPLLFGALPNMVSDIRPGGTAFTLDRLSVELDGAAHTLKIVYTRPLHIQQKGPNMAFWQPRPIYGQWVLPLDCLSLYEQAGPVVVTVSLPGGVVLTESNYPVAEWRDGSPLFRLTQPPGDSLVIQFGRQRTSIWLIIGVGAVIVILSVISTRRWYRRR